MAEIRGRTFGKGSSLKVDGDTFVECTFTDTVLKYGGGAHPKFERCTMTGINWHFTDAALRTIQLLQGLNASESGAVMVSQLFKPGVYIGE
jgi:hypothetical protein